MSKIKISFLLLFLSILSVSYADKNVDFIKHVGVLQNKDNKYCDQYIDVDFSFRKMLGANTLEMNRVSNNPVSIFSTSTDNNYYGFDLNSLGIMKIGSMRSKLGTVFYHAHDDTVMFFIINVDAPPFAQDAGCIYTN